MNLFVGCASRETQNIEYINVAHKVGKFIAENNYNLVFGGCYSGLMKIVYQEVTKSSKSKIIVTMAKAYQSELEAVKYDRLYLADTVNERKNDFLKYSDGLFFLPGGIGTVDELISSIEAVRTGQFYGPIVVFNPNDYFSGIIEQIDKSYKEGLSERIRQFCYITDSINRGFAYIKELDF